MVNFSAQRISERVVAHIHHEIQVITADRFLQNSFCLAGAEAGSLGADEVGIPLITFKSQVIFFLMVPVFSPFYDVVIDFVPQLFTAF